MNTRAVQYITIAVFIIVIGGFAVMNIFATPPQTLQSERRAPTALPAFSSQTFANASFMSGFESWAQDRFPLREGLRTVRAGMVFQVLQQTDKDRLYTGASGVGRFARIDEQAWRQSIDRINRITTRLQDGTIASSDMNFYAAVIPDKSLYAGRYLPGYDQDTANRLIAENLSKDIKAIDISSALAPQDFYKTDLHWDQTQINGVANALENAMNSGTPEAENGGDGNGGSADDRNIFAGTFFGVYAGQIALPMPPDDLSYVSNPYIDTASASYLNPRTAVMEPGRIYYPEALTSGGDPYDFFLRGPQALIVLENATPVHNGRTLYLFRDSFGSSLAPLLLRYYDRVELIDLRYINSRVLADYVTFEPGADVLFLFSSQILGSPTVLMVN